mmetsp:Transcript_9665/g.24141  ORF Transcript_9665/g.24141 Transcript_9665/m.24141 type:complete len:362 (+) Transcript_9665:901-1986(+)
MRPHVDGGPHLPYIDNPGLQLAVHLHLAEDGLQHLVNETSFGRLLRIRRGRMSPLALFSLGRGGGGGREGPVGHTIRGLGVVRRLHLQLQEHRDDRVGYRVRNGVRLPLHQHHVVILVLQLHPWAYRDHLLPLPLKGRHAGEDVRELLLQRYERNLNGNDLFLQHGVGGQLGVCLQVLRIQKRVLESLLYQQAAHSLPRPRPCGCRRRCRLPAAALAAARAAAAGEPLRQAPHRPDVLVHLELHRHSLAVLRVEDFDRLSLVLEPPLQRRLHPPHLRRLPVHQHHLGRVQGRQELRGLRVVRVGREGDVVDRHFQRHHLPAQQLHLLGLGQHVLRQGPLRAVPGDHQRVLRVLAPPVEELP